MTCIQGLINKNSKSFEQGDGRGSDSKEEESRNENEHRRLSLTMPGDASPDYDNDDDMLSTRRQSNTSTGSDNVSDQDIEITTVDGFSRRSTVNEIELQKANERFINGGRTEVDSESPRSEVAFVAASGKSYPSSGLLQEGLNALDGEDMQVGSSMVEINLIFFLPCSCRLFFSSSVSPFESFKFAQINYKDCTLTF
jgi:hypothetical protein